MGVAQVVRSSIVTRAPSRVSPSPKSRPSVVMSWKIVFLVIRSQCKTIWVLVIESARSVYFSNDILIEWLFL